MTEESALEERRSDGTGEAGEKNEVTEQGSTGTEAEDRIMAKKNQRKTKSRSVSAAWKLFYEQGYEDTTIEEIIEESGTSKGSFYHYFGGKDALLGSLAYMMDEKYEELEPDIPEDADCYEVLLHLNRELMVMIEESINLELLTELYSTQLTTRGERPLLDHGRTYYRLLRKIITRGRERGELIKALNVSEMVHYYAMCERALLYEWCLRKGEYSLSEEAARKLPLMIQSLRTGAASPKASGLFPERNPDRLTEP